MAKGKTSRIPKATLEANQKLLKGNTHIKWVWAGQWPEMKQLMRTIKDRHYSPSVSLSHIWGEVCRAWALYGLEETP